MKRHLLHLISLLVVATGSHAAKPSNAGNTEAVASPPEIYWSKMDYGNRELVIRGSNLIGGDAANPEFPAIFVGGEAVALDETASLAEMDFANGAGSVVVSFDEIIAAHPNLVEDTSLGKQISPGDTFAIRLVSASGTVRASLYFANAVLESLAPPPSTGSCPCTAYYDQYYEQLYALLWPICTAPQSSNMPITGPVAVEQYIESSYIDERWIAVTTMGSDSSTSPRSSLAGTCHVRTGSDWPLPEQSGQFLAPPVPVSDEDHLACVNEIIAREAICRGGNWLDP